MLFYFLQWYFYAHCPLVNGLYVLDLEDKSVYNINTKRLRPNDLNPTFIWHCRLGHINEKRIEQLHLLLASILGICGSDASVAYPIPFTCRELPACCSPERGCV